MSHNDIELMQKTTLSMFRKNLLGIKNGSISAKKSRDSFFINRQNTIFDEVSEDDFIDVSISQKALWSNASRDVGIHAAIYEHIPSAKYIAHLSPPNVVAYINTNSHIIPQDYFGYRTFETLSVHSPKDIIDWSNRAPTDVLRFLQNDKKNVVAIKGVGIVVHGKSLDELLNTAAAIEQSCDILIAQKILSLR